MGRRGKRKKIREVKKKKNRILQEGMSRMLERMEKRTEKNKWRVLGRWKER